jgi:hypothetical protein
VSLGFIVLSRAADGLCLPALVKPRTLVFVASVVIVGRKIGYALTPRRAAPLRLGSGEDHATI